VWLPIDEESVNNPWHIWIDVISKFRLMEKRWSTDFTKYCYVLANESVYFKKVVQELFPEIKILVMPKNETWRFKHLLVPSASNTKDGVITPHLAPWLRHFKGLTGNKKEPHRKIVVLRPGAKTRRLKNSEELLLALKGWQTVILEKMTIREQINTFAEATHIVAAHGAGLVNLLWCRPGTKVIEIQDRKMIHKKVYPLLSYHLGLKHELYLADTVPIQLNDGKKPQGIKRLSDLIDFQLDVADLLKYLD
jgi:capsular polysaccharide biosynthesis protein